MFNRRRLFPAPTTERARAYAKSDLAEKLEFSPEVQKKNKDTFLFLHGVKPDKDQLWELTHRMPTEAEVAKAYVALKGSIERQGKNHCIQGTNATLAKIAAGSGYDKEGNPFLFHILPRYKARFIKFIHDEIVVSCPARFAEQVKAEIQSAFKRAAALRMSQVAMESEANIGKTWSK